MNDIQLIMGTPNAYIHAPGLLKQAGQWIGKYGQNVFIVTGEKSWSSAGETLTRSLAAEGIRYHVEKYRGECSYEEVARLKALVPSEAGLIVGVGAGKVLDTAKALSIETSKPFVAVPTLAATCAAVTNLSVMYTEDGQYIDFRVFYRNTILTLVDTDIILTAPARYLIAGIGDTLAKWYEALASSSDKSHPLTTTAGLMMAKLCHDTLIENSFAALAEAERGESGDTLQKVIDAVILISGMVGGLGENDCRPAAAHAIHNGLTVIPEAHHALHGEKVAYGIIVQLVLEERPETEIDELIAFYRKIGLPFSIKDLGISRPLTEEELSALAKAALSPGGTMGLMPFPVTEDMVIDAIRIVEQRYVS